MIMIISKKFIDSREKKNAIFDEHILSTGTSDNWNENYFLENVLINLAIAYVKENT